MLVQTYTSKGNGAFIHSCHTHCEAQTSSDWERFKVNGVSIREALSKWWRSDGTQPATEHTYVPCHLKTSKPHMCNPTCG